MNFPSMLRRKMPHKLRCKVPLRADDDLQRRAENIVSLMMLRGEQPSQDAWVATVRDVLEQYRRIDAAAALAGGEG